ncbi:alkyl hydroperoxide reductase subunit F [Gluconobacter oxydans]|uniref:alkyl hydroperoxide reductase subunit F n=1 Tax=Gluconobacter thailandicus TaxID=257438 RepID=UPI000299834E|nr:alkyl hydroperoxide reductase subunit F [Gluconobacter thailandicus]AFW01135.1 alkyl hydroperoxide reductase [Gluconobacter oxydans H24]ANQ40232.1 alkyl hydroperoxide reductase subunit F [Gluconobacter oxydans]
MLQDDLKTQMRAYMEYLRSDVVLEATLGADDRSVEVRGLLEDIASLSDKVTFSDAGTASRRPSFVICRAGSVEQVTFAGLPMGHEFTSLVLGLLQVSGHPPKIEADLVEQIKALDGDFHFETYFSQSCQNCPDVVQALNAMSVLNPKIRHAAIDGADFPEEVERLGIRSVPQVYLNGEPFASGRMEVADILAKLDASSVERAAAKLKDVAPFDVLVLGAGPAGASAAIYAARKGLRTGLVADRFGGQVMDTAGIENFISVKETEGPQLAGALEAHVRQYDVQIIASQKAAKLVPTKQPGGLHEIVLESGATLRSKTIILATGARWRQLGVPGEEDYRTKGVAYCPHCDGPFYKGRPVVVTGGGNSGVEAAIDLANIVSHVTLLQRGAHLKADKVLQDKLLSLPNVTVLMSALTTKIEGDGKEVTGLTYSDADGGLHHIKTDGVFVQIGLLPNTDWLKGSLDLSPYGEIVINDHCATSVPGIFAAGDATTVPYKQIVIAMGEGAKASLSAFDYLIRMPAVQKEVELA